MSSIRKNMTAANRNRKNQELKLRTQQATEAARAAREELKKQQEAEKAREQQAQQRTQQQVSAAFAQAQKQVQEVQSAREEAKQVEAAFAEQAQALSREVQSAREEAKQVKAAFAEQAQALSAKTREVESAQEEAIEARKDMHELVKMHRELRLHKQRSTEGLNSLTETLLQSTSTNLQQLGHKLLTLQLQKILKQLRRYDPGLFAYVCGDSDFCDMEPNDVFESVNSQLFLNQLGVIRENWSTIKASVNNFVESKMSLIQKLLNLLKAE